MTQELKHVFQITIEAPIQEVWEALTKEGEMLPFFFGSVLHTTGLQPGAPIRMRTPNGKYTGVVGEVLEYEPPHRYAHTFKFTNLDDPECKVIYELQEAGPGRTEFTLRLADVPVGTKTEKNMVQGGEFITKTLKGWVENGKPPFGSRVILTIIKLTGWASPKKCRSEHWPLEQIKTT